MARIPRLPMSPLPRVRFGGRFAESAPVAQHRHSGSELVLVTEGSCRISVDGAETLAGAVGTMFILPADVAHDQVNDAWCRTSYVVFDTVPLAFSDRPRCVVLAGDDPVLGWYEDVCRLSLAPGLASEPVLAGLLLAVLERLKAIEDRAATAQVLPRAIVEATRWLEANLVDTVCVDDIARAVRLSPSHLTALFRAHLGCPPLKYQQGLRLALARKLLRNSYLSVAEVAAACGYVDANYFIRVFRANIGTTPSRWRAR